MPDYRMYGENGAPGCVYRSFEEEFEAESDDAARKIFEEFNLQADKKETARTGGYISRAHSLERIDQREVTTKII